MGSACRVRHLPPGGIMLPLKPPEVAWEPGDWRQAEALSPATCSLDHVHTGGPLPEPQPTSLTGRACTGGF